MGAIPQDHAASAVALPRSHLGVGNSSVPSESVQPPLHGPTALYPDRGGNPTNHQQQTHPTVSGMTNLAEQEYRDRA